MQGNDNELMEKRILEVLEEIRTSSFLFHLVHLVCICPLKDVMAKPKDRYKG